MIARVLAVALLLLAALDLRGQEPKKDAAPDKEAVTKLIRDYLSTEFAERGKFVADPADFKAGQEAYYKDAILAEEIQVKLSAIKSLDRGGRYEAKATVGGKILDRPAAPSVQTFVVVAAKDGLKIDWGAGSGYNPVPYKTWVAGKDGEVTLRVEADLSDYYGYEWRAAKETHYAIRCREESLSATSFTAYIARDSADGKRLHELLKDGEKHRVTVAIQRTGTESAVAGVKSLVSASWVK